MYNLRTPDTGTSSPTSSDLADELIAGASSGTPAAELRDVLDRLVTAADPKPGLTKLFATDAGAYLLPEVAALDLPQPAGRQLHKDNLTHSIQVCAQAAPRRLVRWGALLHDVGKAPTRKIEDGKVTFWNHEVVGERLARRRLLALGFDSDFSEDVARLVGISGRMHGFDDTWTDAAVRRFVRDAGGLTDDALDVARADCTSKIPGRRAQVLAEVDAVAARVAELAAEAAEAAKRPVLDGDAIMAILAVGPGRHVGKARQHLMDLAEAGHELDAVTAGAALRSWWAQQES